MDEFEIRFSGAGGQGLILGARILAEALILDGKQVAQSQSYEPVSRGGVSRSDLVISDGSVDYPLVTALDVLLILDQIAAHVSTDLVKSGGVVLADSGRVGDPPQGDFSLYRLPFTETARKLGSERSANMVALGAMLALSSVCSREVVEQALRANTPKRFLDLNLAALGEGYRMGLEVLGYDADRTRN